MKYLINNKIIKSHNTAKPYIQASKLTIEYINRIESVNTIVDYGCGKLRYTYYLRKKCKQLILVDSEEQLARKQKLFDREISIRELVKNDKDIKVLNEQEYAKSQDKYDIIFIANVLSAIPILEERHKLLENVKNSITQKGYAIFISQYTDTYFKNICYMQGAKEHLDGYLVNKGKCATYYGILPPVKLSNILEEKGFKILQSKILGKSVYIRAN
ncbi:methyltransferase domain-containing protein [Pleomorphochaeta sp. DL1XJH-081]|uniref:methyltransferase domain-containing protein n=1 Tax=Pleomorphochaeta sp. DL1XJH-081 TaxID=3409690 RepID=UPI003BB7EDE8